MFSVMLSLDLSFISWPLGTVPDIRTRTIIFLYLRLRSKVFCTQRYNFRYMRKEDSNVNSKYSTFNVVFFDNLSQKICLLHGMSIMDLGLLYLQLVHDVSFRRRNIQVTCSHF